MSKLPAPVANYNLAPIPRPIPLGYGSQDGNRNPNGSITQVLDGEPRRAFGQRYLRQPREVELERPPRESHRFTTAGSARTNDASATPPGPSATFLAQLIGQSIQDPGGAREPSETGPAHSAYRQAGGELTLQTDTGNQLNLAV